MKRGYPMPRCGALVTLGHPPETVELGCTYARGHSFEHTCEFPGTSGVAAFFWNDSLNVIPWVRPDVVRHIREILKEAA